MKEIKELTGLRFIAALYVFLFHLQLCGTLPVFGWRVHAIIAQGALGVTVFFVLSGIVLTYSHMGDHRGPVVFLPFILKRIIRVAPVYLTGLGMAVVVAVALHHIPTNFSSLLLLNLTFLNAWVPPMAMKWYGGGSWSISAEFFFYCLFPFLLPRLFRLRQRTVIALLACMFVLAALPSLFNSLHPQLGLFNWVYSFPPARLPEFICGMLIAILVFRFDWQVPAWAPVASSAMLVAYLAYFKAIIESYAGHNSLVISAMTAVYGNKDVNSVRHDWLVLPALTILAIGLCRNRGIAFRWLSSPVLTYLGRVSYGFYIWQIVLLFVLGILNEHYLIPLHSVGMSLAMLILNLTLASLSYHLLERRAHRWLSGKMLQKKQLY